MDNSAQPLTLRCRYTGQKFQTATYSFAFLFTFPNIQMCQFAQTLNGLTKLLTLHPGRADEHRHPIFKIHKIEHSETIRETSLFEIANFYEQNHLITKAYDWRNRSMHKWTFFRHDSGRFWSKCYNLHVPHHSMQILVNFENRGACIHRCLLDAI